MFFTDEPVRNYADAAACDLDAYGAWCRALLERGVYPPASQFEAWFPSLAHTDAELERTVEAARRPLPRSHERRVACQSSAARAGRSPSSPRRPRSHPRAPGPAQIAASGPRAAGREQEYELLLEMISRAPAALRRAAGGPPEDPDLALLLGDQLYALGLSRLAALGDLDAVAELAD